MKRRLPILFVLFFSSLLSCIGAPPSKVEMKEGGPAVDGEALKADETKVFGGVLFRTKSLKSGGRSLLVKSEEEPLSISVFGRAVSLQKGGQYQVKWDAESGSISTAAVSGNIDKWVAPPDIYKWFRAPSEEASDETKPRKISFESDAKRAAPKTGDAEKNVPKTASPVQFNPRIPEETPKNGAETEVSPLSSRISDDDLEYVVQPGDTVDLNFYRVQRVTVDMRGDIRVASSVGSAENAIRAAGKTPKEIAAAVLGSGLNFRAISDPALKVTLSKFSDRSIVVLGNVNQPGKVPLEDGEIVGVLGAIKKAGDFARGAEGAVVYVKRGDKITKAVIGESDENALNMFRILPGDIITVNKK